MRHLRIPIWGESRVAVEHAALRRDPVLRGKGVPRGDDSPVMLIPGFMAGDPSLALMAGWLKRIGYRPCRARMRANVDCMTRALDRLEREAESRGAPVAIVGQSRGGTMARALAARRPDLVRSIVTLGSPLTDQLAVHPLVRAHVTALGALGTLGVPGLFGRDCLGGDCCAGTQELISGPFPESVGFVAVYSRSDGIVDWRACLDPAARHVEVRSSHIGMSAHPEVYRVIAEALAPPSSSRLRAAA